MTMARTLRDIDTWRVELGLLPVPLVPHLPEADRFVLLNGPRGNFCLALSPHGEPLEGRSQAWSANVGHFVSIDEKQVAVQRWDQDPGTIQYHGLESVQRNLTAFHSELERLSPSTDLSIVSHSLRVFRSLRASLGSDVQGGHALEGFLYLLASAADAVDRGKVTMQAWGLSERANDVVGLLDDGVWTALRDELERGLPIHRLQPDFRIVLHHASGPLFQEAHYLAQFPYQEPTLPGLGIIPQPVRVGPETEGVGLFFTPPALARTLVEEALAVHPRAGNRVRVFDPACGSGEFLREALRQLRLGGFGGEVDILGWDISEAACAMARFQLAWEARGSADVHWLVEQRDAMNATWPDADIILMNPPFLSVRNLDAAQKERIHAVLGRLARGRHELASAFVWKAAQQVAPGGVLAAVVPASFLEGESFAPVRGALAEALSTHLVARLGNQELFQQARVDTALYVGCRGGGPRVATAVWADHRLSSSSAALRMLRRLRALGHPVDPVTGDGFSIFPNPEIGRDEGGWAPRPFHEWSLRRRASNLPRVEECFDVRQGALTGYNRAFIVPRSYWEALPKSERLFFRPAVLNESIVAGQLLRKAFVFFPYGSYRLSSERRVRERVPNFYRDRLEPHEAELKGRELPGKTKWWELTRQRIWQIDSATKLVSTYFGKAGSFAWDETGEFVVVQGYAWRPKGQVPGRDLWLAYLALLNSDLFEALLSATSDNVGGGQWNLSIRYVKHMPVPRLGQEGNLGSQLAKIGSVIHDEGLGKLDPHAKRSLHELAEAAYGVEGTPDVADLG